MNKKLSVRGHDKYISAVIMLKFKKLKDVSITKKLYFVVGAMAILIIIELLTLWFAIHTLSSVRALVSAEGLWSKAQKDAVYHLRKFNSTHDEKNYTEFLRFMKVPEGDHIARLELLKPAPDLRIAYEGFLQGRVHPDDIDGIIKLIRRFHDNHYIAKAIKIWTEGDSIIARLLPLSENLHTEIKSAAHDQLTSDSILQQIDGINQQLTTLEDDFSFTLGEGSRWLENLILKILLVMALTVEVTGLLLTISVTRGISKGLRAINKATSKVARGDLSVRAEVFSENEIGQVATHVNRMTEQLVLTNRELEQVAYIASHDLQEPLRTIANFVDLFQKQYYGKLDENSDEYLKFITDATRRMQALVKDILDYSRIGQTKDKVKMDCNLVVQEVLADMSLIITETRAGIVTGDLPVVECYPDLKFVFLNLISNAIKFRKKDILPLITIAAKDNGKEWIFTVNDNGIGIEKIYHERIFTIFQKLHSNSEFEGTGIGLANCKKIVDMHQGKIGVQSVPGEGSLFYFTLPKPTIDGQKI